MSQGGEVTAAVQPVLQVGLQKGDVVRLKSGGPIMTASSCDGGIAYCIWFNRQNVKSETFHEDILEKVVRGSPVQPAGDQADGEGDAAVSTAD